MSETKWTNEQWDAITARDCNLLVAAAAGAGKTAVLVERIIKRITDEENPTDIDRLLIVTFTNAAATEMRERIANAISKMLESNPDSKFIQRQLILLGKASITTLHSFCTEVIRSNFQSIDIDPNFRIADETESTLMKLEALNELFEEQYEKEDNEVFFQLLESYGSNRGDELLMDMVLELYDFVQSSPWPEQWLDDAVSRFDIPSGTDYGSTKWGEVLLSAVKLELEGLKDMMAQAVEIINSGSGLENYLDIYQEELTLVESLLDMVCNWDKEKGVWDRLYHIMNNMEFSRLPRAQKDADKDLQQRVKDIRDEFKDRIKKLRDRLITGSSEEITNDLRKLHPLMKCLTDLVKGLAVKYAEKKAKKQTLDFNDLEHICLELLTEKDECGRIKPSDIALKYRERFSEILVDEYQDSNLVQEIIINIISKVDEEKPNVFMVGDVKQSIYRFRQARPELFLDKYHRYSDDKSGSFRKILLYKNFRSRKSVLDAINYVFKQAMSINVGELEYTEKEELNSGALYPEPSNPEFLVGGMTELHLIQTGDVIEEESPVEENQESQVDEDEELIDKIQCEARVVARRILELVKPDEQGRYFAVFDSSKKEYRKIEFRDIVILLRTTKDWADVFAEELSLLGIPTFSDSGSGFFKTTEIQVILSLLQIIDNPLQDIPLLSVLRSPIVSFTADELADVRLAERKGPIYNALIKYAEGTGETCVKARNFIDKLEKWRELSFYLPADELIWRLFDETGYYAFVGAMPGGEQRQANLRILFERARQFEQTSYKGLFNFINFIDRLKSSRGDMGSAKILSENHNVVRIMSIHKSKGLEFPVVFLSGCGKKFNMRDMNNSVLFHQDMGFGPDMVDFGMRISYPSAAKLAIKEKIRNETLSEEIRILYVAMTRAREKLIITGSLNDTGKSVDKWITAASAESGKLKDYDMLKANNFLDWICPALIRHKDLCGLLGNRAHEQKFAGPVIEDLSQWDIRFWDKKDVLYSATFEENRETELEEWLDSLEKYSDDQEDDGTDLELKAEIDRRLNWEYAYSRISAIPAQVSVTELKRKFQLQDSEEAGRLPGIQPLLIEKPMFLEEKKGLSAAEKGTILHFIMQHLDLARISGIYARLDSRNDKAGNMRFYIDNEIKEQIEEMISKELLTRQQSDSIDYSKIGVFLDSSLGQRMLLSGAARREVPFNIEIPCSELYSGMDGTECQCETVLLQGVIDCYFEDSDGIVLIDYKTDYIPEGKEDLVKDRYASQMGYYARALEMLTGKKVKEKYIYLFNNGKLVEF